MYVADEPHDNTDPDWLRVRGYRSLNSAKTRFAPRENDLFTVEIDNIIGKLAHPKLLPGRAIAYATVRVHRNSRCEGIVIFMVLSDLQFARICVAVVLRIGTADAKDM